MNKSSSHLRALLRKNWILWKRSWCVSLCEILIPFAFAMMLVALKQNSLTHDIPTTTYWDQPSTSFTYHGILNPSYFKDCNAEQGGGMVAIVPDPSTDTLAFDVNEALRKKIFLREILIFAIESIGFLTKSFKTNKEIDDYTSQLDYASSAKKTLCFAVVINKNGVKDEYEYMLRFNFTSNDIPDTANGRVKEIVL